MGVVRGCNIPEELHYNIDNNVWARREADGNVSVGLTSYACSLAGEIVSYTPKKAGKAIEKDKSCATVESGKWVGPVKAPVAGEVVAINDAVTAKPGTINRDPYGEGWIVRLKPTNWDADATALKTGNDALQAFEAKMNADGFKGC
ncbi:glycine cleavage system protein H [Sulfurifustis variabilis]|uniref:Glycine cleavage system H protein n=1 Tax=Sulfurifustis variabilis TaxID=1675686 RepID=A0A1B4V7N7_9GAMM|nr:glycine cleavage system protein GcvH [Sulfurifustis variabilis]BAU49543.1 glycine cleavage system protein H [Sulfurifustis variabilis]